MMYNGNKILKTEFVIRYLLGRIRQSGPEPELLPGEMELCAQLNVSRVTVRRALESLSAANYIIRLPKRKGAFSNPEMAKNVPCTIGIVASGCPFQMNGSSAISLIRIFSSIWFIYTRVNSIDLSRSAEIKRSGAEPYCS